MEEKAFKDIEIRSEEVQEVMGKVPSWIVRWGITLLFLVVAMLVVGSIFFKYPDVITAQVTVTTANPPAAIVSRASGKIEKMYVADKQAVKEGDWLAVIENSAKTEDVLFVKKQLAPPNLPQREEHKDSTLASFSSPWGRSGGASLGDIQPAYMAYLEAVRAWNNYEELGFLQKKIDIKEKQIMQNKQHYERLKRQAAITEEQYAIALRRWEKDSLMHIKGGISGPERDNSLTGYLQSRQHIETAKGNLESQAMQIAQLEAELLTLRLEKQEEENRIRHACEHNKEQLEIALKNWEMQYALISPIDGQVTFTTYWSENHTIRAGETAFVVVPGEEEEIVGKALLPITRSGKVKEGQRVNIRFENYPDQEFGMVRGVVNTISLVPVEGHYMIGIRFPEGLKTNYKITLPLSQEMTGSADIITDDLRLIERFIQPVKKIFREGMKGG